MNKTIFILSAIGLFLSIYTIFVEEMTSKNKKYKPFCDFSKNMSCTKAFSSPYGNLIGISNAWLGILFYEAIILLNHFNQPSWIFYGASLASLASVYLAYITFFKLKNLCLVCLGIYLVNILLLILSWQILQ